MIIYILLACLAVHALPTAQGETRLIKTREGGKMEWMTEQDIFQNLTLRHKGFLDVTDIYSGETLWEGSFVPSKPEFPRDAKHVDEAKAIIDKANLEGPKDWLQMLTNFTTRHYKSETGAQASNWLYDQVVDIARLNDRIKVERFVHPWNQSSIIAHVPGVTSKVVIVGAHLDSTAGSPTLPSPGADDNGSGTVTLLEALRLLAEARFAPNNTLDFHWYAGEEAGLLGSQKVLTRYKRDGVDVIALLNQDMTGYSPSKKAAVITDYTDPGLTRYVKALVKAYTGDEPLESRCGYACSDHASARILGFPAASVAEDELDKSNPFIHTINDTIDKIQWDVVLRHINLTVGFLVEASYLP